MAQSKLGMAQYSIHLHQCVQLAYMVLSKHPVLHIGLAESNAQASLHMHSNISHALERGDQSL